MEGRYNRHYIFVDAAGRVTDGWSDGTFPERDTASAMLLREDGGYQFRLLEEGEENPALYAMDGVALYKWENNAVSLRTEAELAADRAAIPAPWPTEDEDRDALLVELDYRLTLLELGVN